MPRHTTLVLTLIALGIWSLVGIEVDRAYVDKERLNSEKRAASDMRAYSAWKYATRYESFQPSLTKSEKEPKRSKDLHVRNIWVKSFQHADVKLTGKSAKYGNDAYALKTVIAFNDKWSEREFNYALNHHVPWEGIQWGMRGEWHSLTMQCTIEQLDSGEWITSDYKFTDSAGKPDFPFDKIKSGE